MMGVVSSSIVSKCQVDIHEVENRTLGAIREFGFCREDRSAFCLMVQEVPIAS